MDFKVFKEVVNLQDILKHPKNLYSVRCRFHGHKKLFLHCTYYFEYGKQQRKILLLFKNSIKSFFLKNIYSFSRILAVATLAIQIFNGHYRFNPIFTRYSKTSEKSVFCTVLFSWS